MTVKNIDLVFRDIWDQCHGETRRLGAKPSLRLSSTISSVYASHPSRPSEPLYRLCPSQCHGMSLRAHGSVRVTYSRFDSSPMLAAVTLFRRLGVSRYSPFPRGPLSHSHTFTGTHARPHTCALSSISAWSLADFVFADNRWADIEFFLRNKYTVCLADIFPSIVFASLISKWLITSSGLESLVNIICCC